MTDAADDLVIGKITGCYGIKGWVRIYAYTDPIENFLNYRHWRVRRRGGTELVCFDDGKRHGKGLVVHIEGVDERTAAEAYRGLEVVVSRQQLPELEQGEYYWHQLEQLQVWGEQEGQAVLLGAVSQLLETGANDVLVVKPVADSVDDKERLIPYLPGQVVKEVSLEQGLIQVDWPIDF